ncbi:antiterminator LoaP [Paenibacillus taichungensis]|uniref:antiterminator LoaP n=1 Tax=Paenibacillus taichungensis TaxID=484184 RepID=UPI0038D1CC60
MSWYALFVKRGEELSVQEHIKKKFGNDVSSIFIPRKVVPERKSGEVRDVIRVLFPGYIFINARMYEQLYYSILDVPSVYYWVKCGKWKLNRDENRFSTVSPTEMKWLLDFIDSPNGILEYSVIQIDNQKAEVLSGPLFGRENLICKLDMRKCRAKLIFEFLEKKIALDVGIKIIEKSS